MHDQPSIREMVQAVKNFVDDMAAPQLKGAAAFHARVTSNVLATILRDIDTRPGADAAEKARLVALLDASPDDSLEALNWALCEQIRSGEMQLEREGLLEHLKKTAIDQVEVDQPKYSGLHLAKKEM